MHRGEWAEVGYGAVRWFPCDRLRNVGVLLLCPSPGLYLYFGLFFLALERNLLIFSFRVTASASASVHLLSETFSRGCFVSPCPSTKSPAKLCPVLSVSHAANGGICTPKGAVTVGRAGCGCGQVT